MFEKYASSFILVSLFLLWNQGTVCVKADSVTVRIEPDYPGSSSFGIHCESADDDLGGHTIAQGSFYSFDFSPNVWGTTLFHCALDWQGRGVSFAIYDEKRDLISRCDKLCLWKVRPDGVVGFPENHKESSDLFFPWTR
ncbi:self-incompatibility protein S1-like [Punica granatum]|nr:self-incompatibility protein S1-like [Punica granatum]XP_031374051.1 self-incompatibility protein S1-like [Punica granatum]XP_031374056.1 self-incompatibility protein S1-like [Punica granatum]